MTARAIVAIGAALFGVMAVPARAETITFTLGSEPAVEVSSPQLFPGHELQVTSPIGPSTTSWFEDVATGRTFSEAILTITSGLTVSTFDFFGVRSAAFSEDLEGRPPTATALFAFTSYTEQNMTAPESSTWAMLLLGGGAVAIVRRYASSRRRFFYAESVC